MEQIHIDSIVDLFKRVKIWNNGEFIALVNAYCNENELDKQLITAKLEIAFRDVLATNISSENAIRWRLRNPLPINAAL